LREGKWQKGEGLKAKGVAKTKGYPNKSISVELVLLNAYVSIIF